MNDQQSKSTEEVILDDMEEELKQMPSVSIPQPSEFCEEKIQIFRKSQKEPEEIIDKMEKAIEELERREKVPISLSTGKEPQTLYSEFKEGVETLKGVNLDENHLHRVVEMMKQLRSLIPFEHVQVSPAVETWKHKIQFFKNKLNKER